MTTTDTDLTDIFFPALIDQMERIATALERLAPLSDYVTLLHTEKTGETIYEVQRYVVGTDGENKPCIWLYATNPGLNFAVTRVYHDHLDKLPYPINDAAKTWDGEVAPSAEAAAKKGYFCVFPAPFSISLMPTGKMTDSGHPVRRLHRVLDAPAAKQPAPAAPPKANGTAAPAAKLAAQAPAPVPASEDEPPWPASDDGFDAEFERMPAASQAPAQAAALAKAAASRPASAPAAEQAALPFKDQGTAVQWTAKNPHYHKPDGTPDYAHITGSIAKLCKELGCSDRNLECWGKAWVDHVSGKTA